MNADSNRSPSAALTATIAPRTIDSGIVRKSSWYSATKTANIARGRSRDEALPRLRRRDGRRELVPADRAADQVRHGVVDPHGDHDGERGEPAVLGNVAQQEQEAEAEADPGGSEHGAADRGGRGRARRRDEVEQKREHERRRGSRRPSTPRRRAARRRAPRRRRRSPRARAAAAAAPSRRTRAARRALPATTSANSHQPPSQIAPSTSGAPDRDDEQPRQEARLSGRRSGGGDSRTRRARREGPRPEVRPERVDEHELGVRELPEEEVRDAHLARRADQRDPDPEAPARRASAPSASSSIAAGGTPSSTSRRAASTISARPP